MAFERSLSRRTFLTVAATAPLASALPQSKKVPIGLELYSVRQELGKDLKGTVTAVAKMGYEVVEFYSPYFSWTMDYAKEIKKLMDDLGIKCNSTHNGANALTGDGLSKAIELNQAIGSKYIVQASAGRVEGLDGWKKVADTLAAAAEKLKPLGMGTGYHNHQVEFKPLDGKRPIEVIAANTPKDVMLQLDIGTCVEVGQDPVAWINANPGRIRSVHLKDWGAGEGKGYQVLFGEGDAPWKKIFEAVEKTGGVEYYLIEQEGSRFTPLETVEKCLASYKKIHG